MEKKEEEEKGGSAPIVICAPRMESQQRQPTPCESQKEEKPSCVKGCDKIGTDVKALISAELERWRKLKSPKEQDKQLADYFCDALKSMTMAQMEEMATMLLARNSIARKK